MFHLRRFCVWPTLCLAIILLQMITPQSANAGGSFESSDSGTSVERTAPDVVETLAWTDQNTWTQTNLTEDPQPLCHNLRGPNSASYHIVPQPYLLGRLACPDR